MRWKHSNATCRLSFPISNRGAFRSSIITLGCKLLRAETNSSSLTSGNETNTKRCEASNGNSASWTPKVGGEGRNSLELSELVITLNPRMVLLSIQHSPSALTLLPVQHSCSCQDATVAFI